MVLSLPTRLFKLDVQAVRKASDNFDFASSRIGTLCDQTELAKLESCSYCAISHFWGRPPKIKVIGIAWEVPVTTEKLLFILKACEKRGYEYLWFDILCIDQRKGALEFSTEMENMQRYYKEAHATIVFGAELREFSSNWEQVDGIIRRWNGDRESVISADDEDLGQVDKLIEDPWFWRVWTLQEAVIPLTTSPLDTIVTNPAPYNRARLLTSNGMPMDLRGLCDYIDWTYVALAKLDYVESSSRYPWIHPGGGVVNDNGWWMLATLTAAIGLGVAKLHPLQAVRMTAYRKVSERHLADYLKGLYGLIDKKWHFQITEDKPKDNGRYELHELWKKMTNKYVEEDEVEVLLLHMAVNDPNGEWGAKRSWAAGLRSEFSGSFLPKYGDHTVRATVENDILKLQASKSEIRGVGETSYGDGSGELLRLIDDLFELQKSSFDTSSIIFLLQLAASQAELTLDIQSADTKVMPISMLNAFSSGLRGIFSGWDRWIITLDNVDGVAKTACLAWFPCPGSYAKDRLSKCSVLQLRDSGNEWGVLVEGGAIVEGQPLSYRKAGVVFLHSAIAVTHREDIVIL